MTKVGRKPRFDNISLADVYSPRFAHHGRCLTVREVEAILRCSYKTVFKMIREKRIAAVKCNHKWLISERSVMALVDFG